MENERMNIDPNDIQITIKQNDGKECLFDSPCCSCMTVVLTADGRLATSYFGLHTPDVVKFMKKTTNQYYNKLYKESKRQYKEEMARRKNIKVFKDKNPEITDETIAKIAEELKIIEEEAEKELIESGVERIDQSKDSTVDKNTKKSTIRTIHEIKMEQVGEELVFTFYGDGFLYHMVRILMGTLLEIGQHRRTPESVLEAFETGERVKAGFLAPAQGLALMQVFYD